MGSKNIPMLWISLIGIKNNRIYSWILMDTYLPVSSNLAWGNGLWMTHFPLPHLIIGGYVFISLQWDPIGKTGHGLGVSVRSTSLPHRPLQRRTTDDEMEFDEASTSPTSTRLPDALEMKLIWHHGPRPIQPEQNLREHFVISEHKYIRSTSTLQTYCCLIHHWFIHQFDVPIYIYE